MTTSASLCEGPIFYFFYNFTFMLSQNFSPYSNLNYSPLGKHHVVGKDPDTYIQLNIYDHELLLLTIIPVVNELGGEH